jgi:5-methylthioadenosine/S-adenosylhomocysteine deaminase
MLNTVPNLVYAISGHEVKTVVVARRTLMYNRQALTADEVAIRAKAQAQTKAIARRVAADPVHRGMALLAAMAAGQVWLDTDVDTENMDRNWLSLASMGKAEDF